MRDQAEKLREIALGIKQQIEEELHREMRQTRVIVITSGKGGVGKSTLALNLALTLCARNKRVILMDADLGLANIDIMLGLVPQYNLHHLILGKKSLKDITILATGGLRIIPGGSGINELANLNADELKRIIVELGKLDGEYDYMIIDTGAGIAKNVITFVLAADEVIVITTPEPTAITDAYGIVKSISGKSDERRLYLVVNRVANNSEGIMVAEKFKLVCQRFLELSITPLGHVVDEPLVGEGIRRQQPFITLFPKTAAAANIQSIADRLLGGDPVTTPSQEPKPAGGIRNFFRRIAGNGK
ncbi:MAG TPA: MinD/ParA family protein [Syntrophomonadaceae bacterium]|nr:MinD/ParA family protein [Syntrophomonadaceae bacterium]